MINHRIAPLSGIIAVVGCATTQRGARPEAGFVPDQATAVRIAEAVWIPIYGEGIVEQRPYRASLVDGVWRVAGTLHCPGGGICTGGTAYAEISRDDGRILFVIHGQ